jgi:large subunit ribosomal protein L4
VRLPVRNVQGRVVETVQVRDDVFDVPENRALVHQVMVGQMANARQGTASAKTRAEVSGGGAKPRPQKGTGRARLGSTRSPQLRGGGVVFGPKPRSYRQRTPKRMRRQALLTLLSDKARHDNLVVVEDLNVEPRTKEMVKFLQAVRAGSSALVVSDGPAPEGLRAARNIKRVKALPAALLNTVDLLHHKTLIMTVEAVREAERRWGGPFVRRLPPQGTDQI